jgi:Spy/CpxP family protein refolding chaperone
MLGPLMLERLDLSSDQRDRVKQILDSHRDEQRALGDRAMKAHQALQDAVSGGTFDESTVRSRAADVAAVEADEAVAQARVVAEVYQILTADQQTRLKEFQAKAKERQAEMQQRMQQRRGQQQP